MKSAAVAFALVGAAFAQGVTDKIAPEGGIPDGCSGSFDGNFEITVAQVTYAKRDQRDLSVSCTISSPSVETPTVQAGDSAIPIIQILTTYTEAC